MAGIKNKTIFVSQYSYMAQVTFMGSKDIAKQYGGFQNIPDEIASNMLGTRKGSKEYIIFADDLIKKEIEKLPNDSFMPIQMKVVIAYLESKNITWEIKGEGAKL